MPQPAAAEADQHLLDFVKDRRILLVLDNYEHLLTGPEPDRRDGYGLVTKMAAAAPQLKLLVTSRSRLNVPAEWLAPLDGLETPPPSPAQREDWGEERLTEPGVAGPHRKSARSAAATLERYSASALFLQCVHRLRPGFRPTGEEAQAIVRICRLLEGVPLAVELAAAWMRILLARDEIGPPVGARAGSAHDNHARRASAASQHGRGL